MKNNRYFPTLLAILQDLSFKTTFYSNRTSFTGGNVSNKTKPMLVVKYVFLLNLKFLSSKDFFLRFLNDLCDCSFFYLDTDKSLVSLVRVIIQMTGVDGLYHYPYSKSWLML